MPLLSVVIPIYNVEKYLRKCVDSVLSQNIRDLEVILVDDGSSDACPQICDDYAAKDERVKVVHKENGGLSDARNCGIRAATGEYLLFLDSDDYWKENCLENLCKLINTYSPDMIVYSAVLWYCTENKYVPDKLFYPLWLNEAPIETVLEYLLKNDLYIGSACTKAVKRSFLLENDLFFKKGIKSEDIEWCFRVLQKVNSMKFLNEQFYVYLKGRKNSITNTIDEKHINDCYQMVAQAYALRDEQEIPAWRRKMVLNYAAYQYCVLVGLIQRQRLQPETAKKIRELRGILKYRMCRKTKMVYYLHAIFGYRIMQYVLKIYMRIR